MGIHTELDFDPLPTLIKIQLVDYGNVLSIHVKDVRKIETEFLRLKFQAFQCKLEDILPVKGTDWTQECVEMFKKFIGNGIVIAKVAKTYVNGLLGVKIYEI